MSDPLLHKFTLSSRNSTGGNDFPHSVGTYPNSQRYLKEIIGHLEGELRREILAGDIAVHLGIDLDVGITETPDR